MDSPFSYSDLILLVATITFLFCYVIAIIVQSLVSREQLMLERIIVALFGVLALGLLLVYRQSLQHLRSNVFIVTQKRLRPDQSNKGLEDL